MSRRSAVPTKRTANWFVHAAGIALLCVLSACGSSAGDASSVDTEVLGADETAAITRSDLPESENAFLDEVIEAVGERSDVWAGFSLEDLPAILALVDENGEMESAFTVFHSNPQAAGNAVPVSGVDGLPDLHFISEVGDIPQPEPFSFIEDVDVGGVATLIFPVQGELRSNVFSNVYVHEAFHAFQFLNWDDETWPLVDQFDYDQAVENYEMAFLEDAALVAAYDASGEERNEAVRHFLALRATRLAEFSTTELDGVQEVLEGTAEWFEWKHTGRSAVDAPYANPLSANIAEPARFAVEWGGDYVGIAPIQRWYHTGATQLELLDQFGVDWQPRIEQFELPATLLAEVVPVDPSEYASLVEEAWEIYDADDQATAVAKLWLTAVATDDSNEPLGESSQPDSFADAPASVIECVNGYGLTPEQLDADPSLLTAEISTDCIDGFQDRAFQCMADAGIDLETADFDNLPAEALVCFE